jgi:hypothetical protein
VGWGGLNAEDVVELGAGGAEMAVKVEGAVLVRGGGETEAKRSLMFWPWAPERG